MKSITVLEGWQRVPIAIKIFGKNAAPITVGVLVHPRGKMYRLAESWEKPDLLISSPVWPPEHDVRLSRVRDGQIKRLVRMKLDAITKRQQKRK